MKILCAHYVESYASDGTMRTDDDDDDVESCYKFILVYCSQKQELHYCTTWLHMHITASFVRWHTCRQGKQGFPTLENVCVFIGRIAFISFIAMSYCLVYHQITRDALERNERLFVCLTIESLWDVDRDVSTATLLVFIRRWAIATRKQPTSSPDED